MSTKPPSATTSAKEKRKPLRQQSTGEKRYVDPFADEYAELLPRDAKQQKKQQQEGRGLHGYRPQSHARGEGKRKVKPSFAVCSDEEEDT